ARAARFAMVETALLDRRLPSLRRPGGRQGTDDGSPRADRARRTVDERQRRPGLQALQQRAEVQPPVRDRITRGVAPASRRRLAYWHRNRRRDAGATGGRCSRTVRMKGVTSTPVTSEATHRTALVTGHW